MGSVHPFLIFFSFNLLLFISYISFSESHLRQMRVFAENPNSILDEFSRDFEKGYLETLSHLHGTKRVKANTVYQEYIADKHHIHMNSTTWTTLTGFLMYLGRESKAIVDETEKGWFIQYIDRDPKVLARQAQLESKIQYELDEVDRKKQEILTEMKYAYQKLNENNNNHDVDNNNYDDGDDDDDKHLLIRNDDDNDHDNKISIKVNLMNNSGKNNNNVLIKKRPILAISGFNQDDDDDDVHDADNSKNKKNSGNNDDIDDNHENKDNTMKLNIVVNKNKVTNLSAHNNSHRMNSINMIIKEEEYRKKSYSSNNYNNSSSSNNNNNRYLSTSTTIDNSKSTKQHHHADKKEILDKKIVDDDQYCNKIDNDKNRHYYKNTYKNDYDNDIDDNNDHNKDNIKSNITITNNDSNQTSHHYNINNKFWLFKYLVVKYINKNHHNYYKCKGIIIKVYHDDFTADVKFDDDDDGDKVLRCKQSDLQTVIPKVLLCTVCLYVFVYMS